MSRKTIAEIKPNFETGDIPTQQQFYDWIESSMIQSSVTIGTRLTGNTYEIAAPLLPFTLNSLVENPIFVKFDLTNTIAGVTLTEQATTFAAPLLKSNGDTLAIGDIKIDTWYWIILDGSGASYNIISGIDADLSAYLPLIGGLMTGDIDLGSDLGGNHNNIRWTDKTMGVTANGLEINADSSGTYISGDTTTIIANGDFKLRLRRTAAFYMDIVYSGLTAARTLTMPDKSGTLAVTSDIVANTNFADTNLTFGASRTHDVDGNDLTILGINLLILTASEMAIRVGAGGTLAQIDLEVNAISITGAAGGKFLVTNNMQMQIGSPSSAFVSTLTPFTGQTAQQDFTLPNKSGVIALTSDLDIWGAPLISLGSLLTAGASFFVNGGAGVYLSFAGNADDTCYLNLDLNNDSNIYDGSDLALRLHWRISSNGGVGDTVGWVLSYGFQSIGSNTVTNVTNVAQQNVSVNTEVQDIMFNTDLTTMTGVMGAEVLMVTLTRNGAGVGQDLYSGNAEILAIELVKI